MVQSWKQYPTGEQLPVYANMFRLACKAVGITMFGDYYRNDKNVEEFQKLYTVVQTNFNLDKTLKYALLTSNSPKRLQAFYQVKDKIQSCQICIFSVSDSRAKGHFLCFLGAFVIIVSQL